MMRNKGLMDAALWMVGSSMLLAYTEESTGAAAPAGLCQLGLSRPGLGVASSGTETQGRLER